jgi:acetoin utilization deacetylase AcuC-like enzyme
MPKVFYYPGGHEPPDSDHSSESAKCGWIIDSLDRDRTQASRRVKAEKVWIQERLDRTNALAQLAVTHDSEYASAIWQGGSGYGDRIDPSKTFVESYGAIRALYAAALLVAGTTFDGSSSRIVGSVGGSVHHARRAKSSGGLAFNSLAVVASLLAKESPDCGSGRHSDILVLDFDGDCGGGTAEVISGNSRIQQIDVAVNDRDAYHSTENATLHLVARADHYIPEIQQILEDVQASGRSYFMCLYSAGVDGCERAAGGLTGIAAEVLAERDRIVFDWCRRVGLRTAYTLGGGSMSSGMSKELLVGLHRQTIEAAAMAATRKEAR